MQKSIFKYTVLSFAISSALYGHYSFAEDYFDPIFIEGGSQGLKNIDLSALSKAGSVIAGEYFTSIYLNDSYIDDGDIKFDYVGNNKDVSPMLTKAQYISFGVKENATPEFAAIPNDQVISNIGEVLPKAFTKYVSNQSRLNISIPQLYINHTAQGSVPENLWDDGLNALFANYAYSGSSSKSDGVSGYSQTSYLNLRSGINLGAWRLRNYSTYNRSANQGNWNSVNTYLERDIKSLKSHLTMGDTYTPGDMFDSFSFRGVMLQTDDAMLPASLRGFAPVIRGVAQSNAQITIRQNGGIIWQSYVSPGPFVIDDLYPTSSSGDIEVSIKEADGSTRTFIQPFASVPIMLRDGGLKYSIAVGQYNQSKQDHKPHFIQGTMIYGLPYTSTIYSGFIASDDYQSLLVGIGKGIGVWGSISLDATIANTTINDETHVGSSFRFQYSKEMLSSGTSFTLAGYRYSTSNYRDFSEANGDYSTSYYLSGDDSNAYNAWRRQNAKRDRVQLNIHQSLWGAGSLYLTGYQQKYWNTKKKEQSMNLGYSANYKDISYSFGYSYTREVSQGTKDQLFSFNVQIPLDFGRKSNTWLNGSMSSDAHGNNNSSVGISGTLLDDNQLSYNVTQSYNNKGGRSSGSVQSSYRSGYGQYNLGYNYGRYTQQYNYGATGSIVVHPYGVTLGQQLGDTSALVHTNDASGVRVENNTGVKTDIFGNAIVPYISPYSRNQLSLDLNTVDKTTDIISDKKTVVPTRGAIVMAHYETRKGYKIYVSLTGHDIPFGAEASVDNKGQKSTGIVDDKSKVFLSGVPEEGTINVSWGGGQCQVPYKLTDTSAEIISISAICK